MPTTCFLKNSKIKKKRIDGYMLALQMPLLLKEKNFVADAENCCRLPVESIPQFIHAKDVYNINKYGNQSVS